MPKLLLSTLVLSLFLCETAAQITFGTPSEVFPDEAISHAYPFDVDGDGDFDILAEQYSEDDDKRGLYWYEQTATPDSFALPQPLWLGTNIYDVELLFEDVDQDGDQDIIVPSANTDPVLYNDGGGVFSVNTPPNCRVGSRTFNFDYDQDGDEDILFYTTYGQIWRIGLRERQGSALSSSVQWLYYELPPETTLLKGIHAIVPWDGDMDGDLDLLVAADLTGTGFSQAYWLVNEGGGVYSEELQSFEDIGWNGTVDDMKVLTGGAGEEVLVVVEAVDPFGYLFSQRSLRTFRAFQPMMWQPPILMAHLELADERLGIIISDIDSDGDEDIATGSREVSWLEQEGLAGTFTVHEYPFPAQQRGQELHYLGDINGDGLPDKFITNLNVNTTDAGIGEGYNHSKYIGWIPGRADAVRFGQARLLAPSYGKHLGTAYDYDADGDPDLLTFRAGEPWVADSFLYVMENGADSVLLPKRYLELPFFVSGIYIAENDSIAFVLGYEIEYEEGYIRNGTNTQVYLLERESSSASGWSSPTLILEVSYGDDIEFGDYEGDGDVDIFELDLLGGGIARLHENQGANTNFVERLLGDGPNPTSGGLVPNSRMLDINGDGRLDLLTRTTVEAFYYLQNDNGELGPPVQLYNIDEYPRSLNIEDFDSDGDLDVVGVFRDWEVTPAVSRLAIYRFDTDTQAFLPLEVQQEQEAFFSILGPAFDIDTDGDKDIITSGGVSLNVAGAGQFTALTGGNSSYYPEWGEQVLKPLDINGDNQLDLITTREFEGLQWQPNFTPPSFVFVGGAIFYDDALDCQAVGADTLDLGQLRPNIKWENTAGGGATVSSNSEGTYLAALPDTSQYTWQLIPPSFLWQSCPPDTTQTYTAYDSVYTLDFLMQPQESCPYIEVFVSSSRLRGCEDGTVHINYQNTGTAAANNQILTFTHEEGLDIISTSLPPLSQTGSQMEFQLPPLGVGESGEVVITVNADCATFLPGHVFCFDASVDLNPSCWDSLSGWDGSDLQAEASCEPDSIVFTLTNRGPGAMDVARDYNLSIVNDDIVMLLEVGDVQLGPDESAVFKVQDTTALVRLLAMQDEEHPQYDDMQLTVDACVGVDSNQLNQQLMQSPNTNYGLTGDQLCVELRGAYDPNIKVPFPEGQEPIGEVPAGTWIDFTVHFQNTGNDTAFLVVIRDTLADCLDLNTIRMGGSSHPYEWALFGQRELEVTFDPIALPDSNINVSGSQGFVQYSIRIKEDCAPGTEIRNRAGIYFDFNPVVLTDYTLHTIAKPKVYHSITVPHCLDSGPPQADSLKTLLFPFPTYDSLLLVRHEFIVPDTTFEDMSVAPGAEFQGQIIETDTTVVFLTKNESGCDSLVVVSLVVVSNRHLLPLQAEVYPNPSDGHIYLRLPSTTALRSVELLDATGRLVWEKQYSLPFRASKTLTYGLGQQPDGIYCLRITDDSGRQANKRLLIKQ